MSITLPAIISAAIASAGAAHTEVDSDAVLRNALSIAIPSLDGARGIQVAYERWLPAHHLSLAASV